MKRTCAVGAVAAAAATTVLALRRAALLVTVHGTSMHPTYADGDRLLALRVGRRLPPRGSVVVGRFPHLPGESAIEVGSVWDRPWLFVKRLLALPGESARIPMSRLAPGTDVGECGGVLDGEHGVWQVPRRQCFVKGDARTSSDSVSWGPVPVDDIVGVVVARLGSSRSR